MFIHPNFPSQHRHLACYFGSDKRHQVVFLCQTEDKIDIPGVTKGFYKRKREVNEKTHHYLKTCEEAVLNAQAAYEAAVKLHQEYNFKPDVIIAHIGWGDAMFLKDLYPDVPLLGYFEWFYHSHGADVGYFPGEKVSPDKECQIRMKNAHHFINLDLCDAGYTPTEWQKKQFPEVYRPKLTVLHDGIDTDFCRPDRSKKLVLPNLKLDLSEVPEIITYVSRGFEDYRGFPQFMEACAGVLKRRPKCHVVLVGSDRVCYGAKPGDGKTFKQLMLERLSDSLDLSRVHFTGWLNRKDYLTVLQASTVHVYLTRPFVLSWSMLEAMSAGCCLVASQTPPVEEVITDGENGLLAHFMHPEHIALRIEEALDDPLLRERLSKNARELIREKYDLTKCLNRQINFIYSHLR